jgi:hypothetical protein
MLPQIPKLPAIGGGSKLPAVGKSGGAHSPLPGTKLEIKPMIKSFNDFKKVHFAPLAGQRLNLK